MVDKSQWPINLDPGLPVYSSGFSWGEVEFFNEENPVNKKDKMTGSVFTCDHERRSNQADSCSRQLSLFHTLFSALFT